MQKFLQAFGGAYAEEALHLQQPEHVRRADSDRHVGDQEEGGEVPGLQVHRLPRRRHVPLR